MLGADGGQPLQVAFWRDNDSGGAGDGLDDAGRNCGRVVQCDEPFKIIRKICAVLGFTACKCVTRDVVRVADVIDA